MAGGVRTARALTEAWAPFEIELAGLQVFPVTNVIYLEIGAEARSCGA